MTKFGEKITTKTGNVFIGESVKYLWGLHYNKQYNVLQHEVNLYSQTFSLEDQHEDISWSNSTISIMGLSLPRGKCVGLPSN